MNKKDSIQLLLADLADVRNSYTSMFATTRKVILLLPVKTRAPAFRLDSYINRIILTWHGEGEKEELIICIPSYNTKLIAWKYSYRKWTGIDCSKELHIRKRSEYVLDRLSTNLLDCISRVNIANPLVNKEQKEDRR